MYKSAIQFLQEDSSAWADETFGDRTPEQVLAHLKREINELIETPDDRLEYADCLILLLESAQLVGLSADDVVMAAFEKMGINKKRKWGVPNDDGSVEHIEE